MFPRLLQKQLQPLARSFPIVTVIGPRQSGKTTLVQESFPYKPYVNFEDPDMRLWATEDPRGLLKRYPDGAIFDEIQRVPDILSYLQGIVDDKQLPGMFILTGSHQLLPHHKVTQSLAGRTVLLTLLPLSMEELRLSNGSFEVDEYLLRGFYPRIYKDGLDPTITYRSYLQTYVERDVRELTAIKDLAQFQRFLKLCAGRIGQILNMESLGNELGLSGATIKAWLSILEASFVIMRLQPYFESFGKRLIKSSKLYFVDVGLAAYLLGIESLTQMERDPLRGNLFENLVFMELVKARYNIGREAHLYYFRDTHQNEIDVIYKRADELIPIEIKSSLTFNRSFIQRLDCFRQLVGARCPEGYVIYGGEQELSMFDWSVINFQQAARVCIG